MAATEGAALSACSEMETGIAEGAARLAFREVRARPGRRSTLKTGGGRRSEAKATVDPRIGSQRKWDVRCNCLKPYSNDDKTLMTYGKWPQGYLFMSGNERIYRVERMLSVTLRVHKGEKMLVACNRELGIVTQGKNWNSLMKNIRDVIKTYCDIPSADSVKIFLEIDPKVNGPFS